MTEEEGREAEDAFEPGVLRFLCRRVGRRNWVEQDRGTVVAWAAHVMGDGATVTRRGDDYLVRAADLALVFRPMRQEEPR